MNSRSIICLVLASGLSASAQLGQTDQTINLKGLWPLSASAHGTRLILAFTNSPSELLSVLKRELTPLRKRDSLALRRKVEVRFGADILGDAELSQSWQPYSVVSI